MQVDEEALFWTSIFTVGGLISLMFSPIILPICYTIYSDHQKQNNPWNHYDTYEQVCTKERIHDYE